MNKTNPKVESPKLERCQTCGGTGVKLRPRLLDGAEKCDDCGTVISNEHRCNPESKGMSAEQFRHNGFSANDIARRWMPNGMAAELAREIQSFARAYMEHSLTAAQQKLADLKLVLAVQQHGNHELEIAHQELRAARETASREQSEREKRIAELEKIALAPFDETTEKPENLP